jgi:hypothetical protein
MENQEKINGYESRYLIDIKGNVTSVPLTVNCRGGKTRVIKEKLLTPFIAENGYLAVDLTDGKKPKRHYLHRLIYEHFVSEITNGWVINHKDGNKLNNSIDNLECVTQRDNVRHYWKSKKKNVGVRYCEWHRGKKWRATIFGKNGCDLGYYQTEEEAVIALTKYIQENMNHLKYIA